MLNPSQAAELVRRYVAAFNAKDIDAVMAFYSEEAVLEDPVGSGLVRGKAAIRDFYEAHSGGKTFLRLHGPIHVSGSAVAFSFMALMEDGGEAKIIEVGETWALDADGRVEEMRAFWGEANVRTLSGEAASSRKYEALPMLGKVALVTGGGSGIGQAAAVEFARQGARVIVAGRRESACKETVALIEEIGGEGFAFSADVTIEDQVAAVVEATIKKYGRLDFAINCAGLSHEFTFLIDLSLEQYEATMAGNARSVFLCMKHQIRAMLDCGNGGAIVNVTSDATIGGLALLSDYSAGKHAATGLTRTAALEYARDGIRINSVAPGPIKTPMLDSRAGTEEILTSMMLMGRIGEPQEVGDAVVWLCSERASFVYGQVLQVDGALGGVSCVAPVDLPPRE